MLILTVTRGCKLIEETEPICASTVTTVTGIKAPQSICSGQLIFEENFDYFDERTWKHVVTLSGGRNSEFQMYSNSPDNSFAKDGNLHIKPRLTAEYYGDEFLYSGHAILPPDICTNSAFDGCEKYGTPDYIINPIRSARIHTLKSFAFKYGTLEVRAKMPAGEKVTHTSVHKLIICFVEQATGYGLRFG